MQQQSLTNEIIPKTLKEHVIDLFSSKSSLHSSPVPLHYSGIKHELKYYNDFELIKVLKHLVKTKQLFKYRHSRQYKTSVFTTKRVTKTTSLNYHNTIESCIMQLNFEKGYKLEILISQVLKKLDSNVQRNVQNPEDRRRDLDVMSDNFIIESKNWSRSQKITIREVNKFIDNLNHLSKTNLREGRKAIFVGTHFTNNAKRLLEYNNIIYIEIGFQVVSYNCKSLAKLLFAKFGFTMAKDVHSDTSIRIVYVKLYYFFYNAFDRSVNAEPTTWKYIMKNMDSDSANLIKEDLVIAT